MTSTEREGLLPCLIDRERTALAIAQIVIAPGSSAEYLRDFIVKAVLDDRVVPSVATPVQSMTGDIEPTIWEDPAGQKMVDVHALMRPMIASKEMVKDIASTPVADKAMARESLEEAIGGNWGV